MKVLVSIIIPAYNEARNIGRLLKSIKDQTYKAIEVIVVDDESKDKTAEIARNYTSKVYTRKHTERSAQRNFGAKVSRGEYLIFLDADMELTRDVIRDCVVSIEKEQLGALIIPERTVGGGIIAKIRMFEREMYAGDFTVEVARMFKREIFFEYGGYDLKLTGPEDYDLPYRISKKYGIGRANEFILHHEEELTLVKLLRKRYYYAQKGASYASKHPELISTQGNLFFRKAFLKNWKKFLTNPLMGIALIFVRVLEQIWAIAGFISSVGIISFIKILPNLFK